MKKQIFAVIVILTFITLSAIQISSVSNIQEGASSGMSTDSGEIIYVENIASDGSYIGRITSEKDFFPRYGYVTKDGEITVPFVYKFIAEFEYNNALALTEDDLYIVIDKENKLIDTIGDTSEYSINFFSQGHRVYLQKGNFPNDGHTPKSIKSILCFALSGELVWEYTPPKGQYIYQFLNDLVVTLVDTDKPVSEFKNAQGYVYFKDHFINEVRLTPNGAVDESAKTYDGFIVRFDSDRSYSESDTLFCAYAPSGDRDRYQIYRYGYVDRAMNIVIPLKYVKIGNFKEGVAVVFDDDGKYLLINEEGEELGFLGTEKDFGYSPIEALPVMDNGILIMNKVPTYYDMTSLSIFDKSGNLTGKYTAPEGNYINENYIKIFEDKTIKLAYTSGHYLSTRTVYIDVSGNPVRLKAIPTSPAVILNGVSVNFQAYNIHGSNYFKLRDIAYALNNTEKKFDIEWSGEGSSINIIKGKSYIPVGNEMATDKTEERKAASSNFNLFLDGEYQFAEVFNIDGSNYYKLRDICTIFDIEIVWVEEINSIIINT